jgi:hypothetical protein
MGMILDGSGKPMETVGSGNTDRQGCSKAKKWSKAIWAIVVDIPGTLAVIAGVVTHGDAIKKAIWQEAVPRAEYTSLMSDQEVAEVVSLGDELGDSVDNAAGMCGWLYQTSQWQLKRQHRQVRHRLAGNRKPHRV